MFLVPPAAGPVLAFLFLLNAAPPGETSFRRGDANGDGAIDLVDPILTLAFLFSGASAPPCLDAADSDDSGSVEVSDAIRTLNYLFLGGLPPAPPFPEAGRDPTLDALSCRASLLSQPSGQELEAYLETLLAEELESALLASGGFQVTAEVLDLSERLEAGESLADHLDVPGVAELLEEILPLSSPAGSPVAFPDGLRTPPDPDGCFRIDARRLRGRSRDGSGGSAEELRFEVDPEVVCGLGRHLVRFTVIDGDGLRSSATTEVVLCDPEDPLCREEFLASPAAPPGVSRGTADCYWIWSVRELPARRERSLRAVHYDQDGSIQRIDQERLDMGSGPMELYFKRSGEGPQHAAAALRASTPCSTAPANYALAAGGKATLRLNVLCLDCGVLIAFRACRSVIDVEGYYQGQGHVDASSAGTCSTPNGVEGLAANEALFEVNGAPVFDKALILQRGTQISRSATFSLGARLGESGNGVAADPGARFGYSHHVIDRAGVSEGTLGALGSLQVAQPLHAVLQARGRAELAAAGRAGGLAAVATDAAGIYAVGFTSCPCAEPVIRIGRIHGRGQALDDILALARDLYRTRGGDGTLPLRSAAPQR
jgi:hypothetical protein